MELLDALSCVPSFDRILGATLSARGARYDANETVNLQRSLISVDKRIYTAKYPELIARELFPKISDVAVGADSYAFSTYDISGEATVIENFAGDLPSVSMWQKEDLVPCKYIGASFSYSIQDLARAAMTGVDISAEKPLIARRVIENKIDQLLAFGDSSRGIPGALTNASISLTTPVTGSWTTSTTADQIRADVQKLISAVRTNSKGAFAPNKVLVPDSKWNLLLQPRSTTSDTTILKWLQECYDGKVEFTPWVLCNSAGAGSVTRALAGFFDQETAGAIISEEFTPEPAQARGLAFDVPCHAKCGGTAIRFPVAFGYMDGL